MVLNAWQGGHIHFGMPDCDPCCYQDYCIVSAVLTNYYMIDKHMYIIYMHILYTYIYIHVYTYIYILYYIYYTILYYIILYYIMLYYIYCNIYKIICTILYIYMCTLYYIIYILNVPAWLCVIYCAETLVFQRTLRQWRKKGK